MKIIMMIGTRVILDIVMKESHSTRSGMISIIAPTVLKKILTIITRESQLTIAPTTTVLDFATIDPEATTTLENGLIMRMTSTALVGRSAMVNMYENSYLMTIMVTTT